MLSGLIVNVCLYGNGLFFFTFVVDDDIDGMPMFDDDEKLARTVSSTSHSVAPGFVPSRWESVEPDQIEAGAVTSQRWNNLNSSPQRITPPRNHRFASDSPPSPENNDSK